MDQTAFPRRDFTLPPGVCYSQGMAGKSKKSHPGRGGMRVSLAPLTPDQALAGLLRVKPEDVKRLEAAEKAATPRKKRKD